MKTDSKISVSTLTNVPETMLVPLYLKAKETVSKGVITDNKAVEIVEKIDYDFSRMDKDWRTRIGVAVRTIVFDDIVSGFLTVEKKPVIVNLGAGLDTRQVRFPGFKWYHLDLPKSIAVRKQFFNDNAILVEKSILDFTWIDEIEEKENVLFIAEGLLMYFAEGEIKLLLEQISMHFTKSFVALNTIHQSMVGKKHPSVKTDSAPMKWGIRSVKDIEALNSDLKTVKIYYPLDYYPKRWKWMRWLNYIPSMRSAFVIVLMKTLPDR